MDKITQEINQSRAALENAVKIPTIQSQMAAFGFRDQRFKEGKAVIEKVEILHSLKKDKYDVRQQISLSLNNDIKMCREQFMEHVKVARQAFRQSPAILRQLEIDRRMPSALYKWLPLAKMFYRKLADVRNQMKRYQISTEEIAQGSAMVASILVQLESRMVVKGEAEDITQKRNIAEKEMRRWMKDFYKIARIALHEHPQLLEALGILVRSEKV